MVTRLPIWCAGLLLLGLSAVFTGCSDETAGTGPGPAGSEFDISEYSWSGTGNLRYITTHSGETTKYYHDIAFEQEGDSIIAIDILSQEGGGLISTELFSYKTEAEGLIFRSYSPDALLRLPASMQMYGSRTGDSTALTMLQVLTDSVVLAGTVDGGVMKYNYNTQMWRRAGNLKAPMPIIHFAVDRGDPDYIYAATAFAVWYTTDGGNNWEKIQHSYIGKISGITLHDKRTLIVAYSNWVDIGIAPFSTRDWSPPLDLSKYGMSDNITALTSHHPPGYTLLYLGTQAGNIYPITMTSTHLESYGPLYGTQFFSEVTKLIPLTNSQFKTFAITRDGQLAVESLDMWTPTIFLNGCTSAALTSQPDAILVGTSGGCYVSNGYDYKTYVQTGYRSIRDLVYTNQFHMALTDIGPSVSPDDGLSWLGAGTGLKSQATFGGLNLMPTGTQTVGQSWEAGQVVVAPGGPLYTYTVLGTITLHLDELYSPDQSQQYNDVIVVDYTLDARAGSNATGATRNWKMYYAKGLGLVMIQEYDGTSLLSTSYMERPGTGA